MSLWDYLDDWQGRFDWAESNCVHFVAGWVKVRTGKDILEGHELPRSALGLARFVVEHGGIEKAAALMLDWPVKPTSFVQPGDIIVARGGSSGWSFGICVGRHSACLDAQGKIVYVQPEILAAWGQPT